MEETPFQKKTREEKLIAQYQARIEEFVRRIAVLENQLRTEKLHARNERTRFFRLESFVRTYPKDQSYVAYLRTELRTAEEIIEKNQMTIESYQRHYAKYGSFYTEWEEAKEKMLAQCKLADAPEDDNISDSETEHDTK